MTDSKDKLKYKLALEPILQKIKGWAQKVAICYYYQQSTNTDRIMTEIKGNDKEFLEYIVKALVDHPDEVKIDRKVDEMGVLLSLKVNPEDMGQIIGKAGSTARSIRSLVRIVGLKNHARVNLKIEEPEGGRAPRPIKSESIDDLKL